MKNKQKKQKQKRKYNIITKATKEAQNKSLNLLLCPKFPKRLSKLKLSSIKYVRTKLLYDYII